jgi:hypothetical protein
VDFHAIITDDEARRKAQCDRQGGTDGDHSVGCRSPDQANRERHPREVGREARDMTETRRTTTAEARRVGDEIGVDWSRFDLEQFRTGMDVEFEHGAHDPQTDVTGDDPIITGKIALAHMKEFPDYYERLERMEREAERDWSETRL